MLCVIPGEQGSAVNEEMDSEDTVETSVQTREHISMLMEQ